MGSRRGRYSALAALLGALALGSSLVGCAVGAPPGFSEGDRWVIPLVGPLEDGLLLVPALVNDKGPYVFAIDPDAHVSIIDREVVDEVKPRTGEGPRMLDESDTQQNRFYGEILSWQIGTLTVAGPKPAQIVGKGTFDADGRRIHGVIGRDIIADSLVFGFDREMGVVTLTTQKAFKAPPNASVLSYSKLQSRIPNVETLPRSRLLVQANIGGASYAVHVDFGATTSQLRPRSWPRAQLAASEAQLAVVDEAGMLRPVKQKGVAPTVTAGAVTSKDVVFVPYNDKRWPDQDIEGSIGLGFFKPYNIVANWDRDQVYVTTRKDPTLDIPLRLGRWQSKTLTACADVGCVKVSAVDPLAGKPPEERPEKHPGLVLSVVRDRSAQQLNLEVLIAVTPAEGKPPLKWLVASLPAGSDRAMTHLPVDYLDASYTVLDAGMFPRTCPAGGACIDRIEAPQVLAPAAVKAAAGATTSAAPHAAPPATPPAVPASAPAEPEAQQVPSKALEGNRVAGSMNISPDDETKKAMREGKIDRIVASLKLCLDEAGVVDHLSLLQSSGFPAYDTHILGTIKNTWRYTPYLVDGKPTAACTLVTFIYNQK
jgi:hypothetical protein